jgi:hypothetical protein
MELLKFIHDNNIDNFDSLKNILESDLYNLKIKEDSDYPKLFLIHTQDNSAYNIPFVNECNGIILEKNTFKIMCYTFTKCKDTEIISDNIDLESLYYEKALEGTLIRLFFYENKWIISSKKCIDAAKTRWLSDKSFAQLFEECVQSYTFVHNLNQNYCYSFVIMHHENKIIVNYTNPSACHISTRDLDTLKEIDVNIGVPKSEKTYIDKKNMYNLINNMNIENLILYEGIVFIDIHYNRWKVKTDNFKRVRNLWGNTNNRFYRFLELRKDCNLLNEYLNFFSYDRDIFLNYEMKINNLASDILHYYITKHVNKIDIKIPFYYSKIIYKLHGDYFKSKIKTDHNKIMITLLELEPKQVIFMMKNYNENKMI